MQQIRKRQKTANKADNDQAKPKLKKVRQQDRDEEGHASGYTVLSLLAILILFLIARGLAAWLNIINGNNLWRVPDQQNQIIFC